jgi:hypothetical protein
VDREDTEVRVCPGEAMLASVDCNQRACCRRFALKRGSLAE